MTPIQGTPYEVDTGLTKRLESIAQRVSTLRSSGKLTNEALVRLRKFFRIKNIYHSNAIEGNMLDIGETRLVVEQGLTLTGRSLKDQAESKNLSHALDFLEDLAAEASHPLTESNIRQLHHLVLKNIVDSQAGKYRTVPVEISGSLFPPPGPESVPAQMQDFGNWLRQVSCPNEAEFDISPIAIATAVHTWFVTIHPFIDGNGRVARLLLNIALMRFGYPIAIITKSDRKRYYDALEESQLSDLTPMVSLVAECLEESIEEYEAALLDQRQHEQWASSIASKFQEKEKSRASNQYEVWRSAMELLRSVFRQTAEAINDGAPLATIWFKEFGQLDLEKYMALKTMNSAKRTWFFRIDFKSGEKLARYLFFFGSPSWQIRSGRSLDVTLHLAREEPVGSFHYERLELITAPNVPTLVELGYDSSSEQFVGNKPPAPVVSSKIETFCQEFFEDVVNKHFRS